MATTAIGLMDGAFFVGRKEIMDWINDTLDLNLSKIEDTASGGVACQLLDIMHPGQVSMSKINWGAKQDFEYIANYKLLQTSFAKLSIDKYVDVDRLIRGKYQDNLEFMQWFKRYFEMQVQEKPLGYDSAAQRLKGKGGQAYNAKWGKSPSSTPRTITSAPSANASIVTTASSSAPKATSKVLKTVAQKENRSNASPLPAKSSGSKSASATSKTTSASARSKPSAGVQKSLDTSESGSVESIKLKESLDEVNKRLSEQKLEMDGLEKERDFYFDKLRDIECMLQELVDSGKGNELTESIFKILYATAEGFEQVEDDVVTGTSTVEPTDEEEVNAESTSVGESLEFNMKDSLDIEAEVLETF